MTFWHSRFWDFIAGLPCIFFNLLAGMAFALLIVQQMHQKPDLALTAKLVSQAGSLIFFWMQAVLVCIRRLPRKKVTGIAPRAIAILAAYSSFALLLLRKAPPSLAMEIASSLLLFLGTLGSIATLIFLRRAFAILPQARLLVTGGPYRYCRHPLYLCEQISLVGVSLQFTQPWAGLIVLLGLGLQFPRMMYEEQVLLETFPVYRDYKRRTPMLIPGGKPAIWQK